LGGYSNKGKHLAIIKVHVVTIIAAWIKTDTRMGYSSIFYASTRPKNKNFGVLGNELVSLTIVGTRLVGNVTNFHFHFYFFCNESIWLAHHNFFWNMGHSLKLFWQFVETCLHLNLHQLFTLHI
jgi:hypothetical protein